jgi:hypothetical protein
LLGTFGSLVEATVANQLATDCPMHIDKQNANKIAKGMISMRLLTTYKLKNSIIEELEKANLTADATLS